MLQPHLNREQIINNQNGCYSIIWNRHLNFFKRKYIGSAERYYVIDKAHASSGEQLKDQCKRTYYKRLVNYTNVNNAPIWFRSLVLKTYVKFIGDFNK